MRLLFLTSRLPYPPDRGDRLRAYHFLRQFAEQHELTLLSFVARASERDLISPLQEFCREVHLVRQSPFRSALAVATNIWREQPFQALYYRSGAMQRLVDTVLSGSHFDAAYIHLFRMAPYMTGHPEIYRIVDLTDVVSSEISRSLPFRRLSWRCIYRMEQPRIERYEQQVAKRFEETWLISEADRQVLIESCPGTKVRVVPNGVDLDDLRPLSNAEEDNSLIFVGHMRVFHNVDAARVLTSVVLPQVRSVIANCTVKLVGADPGSEVLRMAADPAVTVTGFVPDLNQALNDATLFVAPLRFAAGVQNKVLEAMAAGRPVVTTSLVCNGLGAMAGRDLIVADSPAEMAEVIIQLLENKSRRQKLGDAGRAFVKARYSWKGAAQRLQQIARELGV